MSSENGAALGGVYDADAHVSALQCPRIKVGGKVYVGRVLSSEQVAPYFASLDALLIMQEETEQPTNGDRELALMANRLERVNVALRPLLRMVFPRPRFRPFWRRDPVEAIMHLPLGVRTEWLKDFFVCVRSSLPTSTNQKPPSSDSGA